MENESKPEQPIEQTEEAQLLDYAKEHFMDYYSVWAPEVKPVYEQTKQNAQDFNENILPNAPAEVLMAADAFLAGYHDLKLIKLFNRFNISYQQMLDSEESATEKRKILISLILKAQTYEVAVAENRQNGIQLVGFENDSDFTDAADFLLEKFGSEILHGCLISQIVYKPETTVVILQGTWFLLPLKVYEDWQSQNLEITKYKVRAENTSNWNLWSKKFMSTPIIIYSFVDEHPENLDYLVKIPDDKKMRLYKFGTIAHEIGHSIHMLLTNTDQCQKWQQIVDRTKFSTAYSRKYQQKNGTYSEAFAEAIRLITTVPEYLQATAPEIYSFLIKNFPDLEPKK
jgi:hypothetical protein